MSQGKHSTQRKSLLEPKCKGQEPSLVEPKCKGQEQILLEPKCKGQEQSLLEPKSKGQEQKFIRAQSERDKRYCRPGSKDRVTNPYIYIYVCVLTNSGPQTGHTT